MPIGTYKKYFKKNHIFNIINNIFIIYLSFFGNYFYYLYVLRPL